MSTVWLSPSHTPPQITYTLITADSPNCLGHSTAPVQLQYRLDNTEWTTLDPRKIIPSNDYFIVMIYLLLSVQVMLQHTVMIPLRWHTSKSPYLLLIWIRD